MTDIVATYSPLRKAAAGERRAESPAAEHFDEVDMQRPRPEHSEPKRSI
ncbi:MAG: hypothetical protein U0625_01400 [Phycisphaerales bacterium]